MQLAHYIDISAIEVKGGTIDKGTCLMKNSFRIIRVVTIVIESQNFGRQIGFFLGKAQVLADKLSLLRGSH